MSAAMQPRRRAERDAHPRSCPTPLPVALRCRRQRAAATLGFVGTPGFAAPELYAASATFTNAIDVYAFGATALFLGTGGLPADLMNVPPTPSPAGYFGAVGITVAKKKVSLASEIVQLLDSCIARNAGARPSMAMVRDTLARHLLFEKHQALVVFRGEASYLNTDKRVIALELPTIGRIEITYDGLMFRVTAANGEVSINNRPVAAGHSLPGCCVVALGSQTRRNNERAFITFDLSHPEIVV